MKKDVMLFVLLTLTACKQYKQPSYPPSQEACQSAQRDVTVGEGGAVIGGLVAATGGVVMATSEAGSSQKTPTAMTFTGIGIAAIGIGLAISGSADLVSEGCGVPRTKPVSKTESSEEPEAESKPTKPKK